MKRQEQTNMGNRTLVDDLVKQSLPGHKDQGRGTTHARESSRLGAKDVLLIHHGALMKRSKKKYDLYRASL